MPGCLWQTGETVKSDNECAQGNITPGLAPSGRSPSSLNNKQQPWQPNGGSNKIDLFEVRNHKAAKAKRNPSQQRRQPARAQSPQVQVSADQRQMIGSDNYYIHRYAG